MLRERDHDYVKCRIKDRARQHHWSMQLVFKYLVVDVSYIVLCNHVAEALECLNDTDDLLDITSHRHEGNIYTTILTAPTSYEVGGRLEATSNCNHRPSQYHQLCEAFPVEVMSLKRSQRPKSHPPTCTMYTHSCILSGQQNRVRRDSMRIFPLWLCWL